MFAPRKALMPLPILFAAVLIAGMLAPSAGGTMAADAQKPAAAEAKLIAPLVQSFDKAEEIKYPWGWIRWLMSSKINPESEMTFGIVRVNPNVVNPAHVHPNCEEHLHVLSGSCEHRVGKKWFTLKKGDTIRIPTGVPHQARTLKEPLLAVIVYSSGDRQFELAEEGEKE